MFDVLQYVAAIALLLLSIRIFSMALLPGGPGEQEPKREARDV